MPAAHVEHAAMIAVRADQHADLVAIDEADMLIAVAVAEMIDMRTRVRDEATAMIDVQIARRQIAGDAIARDQPIEMRAGIDVRRLTML